jgi:hypothetical protein
MIRRVRTVAASVVIAVIVGSLAAWTLLSPAALSPQNNGELYSGIFSASKSVSSLNLSDGAGSYSFLFGLDYVSNISQGSAVEFKVYGALVDQKIDSGFTRAISLQVDSASMFVNSSEDTSSRTSESIRAGIMTESFQNPNTNIPLGVYNLTIRLLVSTVDLNYVGYSVGTMGVVTMAGNFSITS